MVVGAVGARWLRAVVSVGSGLCRDGVWSVSGLSHSGPWGSVVGPLVGGVGVQAQGSVEFQATGSGGPVQAVGVRRVLGQGGP